jgi:hypothetical protein
LEDEDLYIIPTKSRAKHSKLVSYPIGAEALSRALDGVPQHKRLTCTFYAGNPNRDVGKEVFRVFYAHYRQRPRSFFDGKDAALRGVFASFWDVWVYDVLIAHRADIKKALIEVGLPEMVRPWLMANAGLEGKVGEAIITLDYNTTTKTLFAKSNTGIQPERS